MGQEKIEAMQRFNRQLRDRGDSTVVDTSERDVSEVAKEVLAWIGSSRWR